MSRWTLAAALLLSLLWVAQPVRLVHAQTFAVTKSADSADGTCDSDCSLREAIVAANANPGADTITLAANTYTLSLAGAGNVSVGDLNIVGELTITGVLSSTTVIDAKGIDRIFHLEEGSHLRLANLHLRNGLAPHGGAIYNVGGRLAGTSIMISHSKATGGGGGILSSAGGVQLVDSLVVANRADGSGGGLYVDDGGVLLERVVVRDNSAGATGGGLFADISRVTVADGVVTNNSATGDGGGIYNNESTLLLSDTLLAANTSAASGGGLVNTAAARATLVGTSVHANRATFGGGGLVNRSTSTLALESTSVRANQATFGAGIVNVRDASNLADLRLVDSIVQGNTTTGMSEANGGGIYGNGTVAITASVLLDNRAEGGYGGGIYLFGTSQVSGSLTLAHSTLRDNRARYGGGLFTERYAHAHLATTTVASNSATASGGGIYAGDSFTISESAIITNTSRAEGGGLIFTGLSAATGELRNSTVSVNTSGTTGGGLYVSSIGTLKLNNLTIANNSADGTGVGNGGGGGIANPFGTVALKNTIVAGNTNRAGGAQEEECVGTLTSEGYNLIQQTAGCTLSGDGTGTIIGQNPKLGPLGSNGGPTPTHNLLAGSPAIDAGSPAVPGNGAACEAQDQRGVSRPQGFRCDIGAVERGTTLGLAIAFKHGSATAGLASELVYTILNPTDGSATGVAFTATLSEGLRIAGGGVANSCVGQVVVGGNGGGFTLSGGRVAANSSCAVVVNVVAPIGGTYGSSAGPVSGAGIGGTAAATLLLVDNPIPLVSDVRLGSDGSTLTVTGSGFVPVSGVVYALTASGVAVSTLLPTTFVSASELRATVTAAQRADLVSARISVVNPAPGGGGSNATPVSNPPDSPAQTYRVLLPLVVR